MYKVEQFIHHGLTGDHDTGFYRVFEVKFYNVVPIRVIVNVLTDTIIKSEAPTKRAATAARWVVNTWLRQQK